MIKEIRSGVWFGRVLAGVLAALTLLSFAGCDGTVAAAPSATAAATQTPHVEAAAIPEETVLPAPTYAPTPTPTPAPTPTAAPDPGALSWGAGAAEPTASPGVGAEPQVYEPLGNERNVDPNLPMVALTFDDGPHKTHTNTVLDTLEQYGAVATFFCLGNLVNQYPETVLRAHELGCEIASHTYSHKDLAEISEAELRSEVDLADEAIAAAIGQRPRLLRPPYGSTDEEVRAKVGHPVVLWSVDTLDWEHRDVQKTFDAIKVEGDLDGKVILMHDIRESTAEAVKLIVPWLLESGYQLVTVSEMIEIGMGDTLENGKKYGYSYFRR